MLCEIARVSKSGYYRWLKQADSSPQDYGDYLLIKELFDKGKGKLGHRAIQMGLKSDKDVIMNHKKVNRIMNKYRLICQVRRRNPYKSIMKKGSDHRTCENILNRNFQQSQPLVVLCTDITYLPFHGRFAYLSVIKDIATKEIVAWNLSWGLGMSLVFDTINNLKDNAISNLWNLDNVLIHSDQGFHYTIPEYISLIKELSMIQSMSRKGNCIDNAPIESFFGHFKDEVDYKGCQTIAELRSLIAEYIDYYNNRRYQWELKKMTPVQYRNHLLVNA